VTDSLLSAVATIGNVVREKEEREKKREELSKILKLM